MSKDRARPFSRKHRKYWFTVTGGMILIGVFNVAIGYCSYTKPSDVHERIIPDVPSVPGSQALAARPAEATGCAPSLTARIEADLPGATMLACTPDRVTVQRGDHRIDLELAGGAIAGVAESLGLSELPAAVMRAFAVAYPRTLPAAAVKRTRGGAEPIYELAFPPGAAHHLAVLRADGGLVELR